jgi:hypothetical protein
MIWSYAGDALWVIALSIMFGASRQAWRRIALQARTWRGDADLAFILFGVRAVSASLLALLHLRWLEAAMSTLEREGQLRS